MFHTFSFANLDDFSAAVKYANACWSNNLDGKRPEICSYTADPQTMTVGVSGINEAEQRFKNWLLRKELKFTHTA